MIPDEGIRASLHEKFQARADIRVVFSGGPCRLPRSHRLFPGCAAAVVPAAAEKEWAGAFVPQKKLCIGKYTAYGESKARWDEIIKVVNAAVKKMGNTNNEMKYALARCPARHPPSYPQPHSPAHRPSPRVSHQTPCYGARSPAHAACRPPHFPLRTKSCSTTRTRGWTWRCRST